MAGSHRIYIYQHVPKCAGTSFRWACQNMGIHVIHDDPPGDRDPAKVEAYRKSPVADEAIVGDSIICGHFIHEGVRPWNRYGPWLADGRAKLITLLRDPLERMISAYFFRRKRGRETFASLEARLERTRNPIARHLGIGNEEPEQFLDRYFCVLVAEQLQTSLDVFAALAGRTRVEAPRENQTPREPHALSDAAIASFRENNALDYALYGSACSRLDRTGSASSAL